MRNLLCAIVVFFSSLAFSQGTSITLGPVSAPTSSNGNNEQRGGIQFHQITWTTSGTVSSCAVAVDSSADGVTWSAAGVIASQTCTSNGNSTFATGVFGFVRINVTTLTGGGSITVVYNGYTSLPAYSVTSTNLPATVDSGNGATSSNTPRVTISNDSTGQVKSTNFPATVDTNTGNAGASTLRFALATNQPNLTTPLNIQGPSTQGSAPTGQQLRVCATDGTNCQDLQVDPASKALLVSGQSTKATYSSAVSFSPGSSSDIFGLCGSGTKTVRLTYMTVSGTATAASAVNWSLQLRSTADTLGGIASLTAVKNDSNNAAATASAVNFSSGPTTGTSVGGMRAGSMTLTTPAGAIPNVPLNLQFGVENDQEIVLRGTAQCVYFNQGSNPTGESLSVAFQWTEE